MIFLDTDTLSLYTVGHPRIAARIEATDDEVVTTIVTRIEILQGRFDFLLKAADSKQLERAQLWLDKTEHDLIGIPILAIDPPSAAAFDRVRQNKKLKKLGRADLLIASIALAHDATLVTRNLRHFKSVPGLRVEDWAR